ACSTALTPRMLAATVGRSTIEPTTSVNGEASTSSPTAAIFLARSVRISASPRWPALPVTSIFMAGSKCTHEKIPLVRHHFPRHRNIDAVRFDRVLEQDAPFPG